LQRDLACAALGLVLAGAYWAAANALPRSLLSDAVGADGVPKALAVLLAVFSLLVGIRGLFLKKPPEKKDHLRALGIAALGFLYVAAASFVGYVISITLLAGAAALYYGARRRTGVALFAVGTAAVLWVVFGAMLGIPLPQ
jgi:putative tricarboxylic transport membrane protein